MILDQLSISDELVMSFLETIQVSITGASHFFMQLGYVSLTIFVLSIPFMSICHARLFIYGENRPSVNMV